LQASKVPVVKILQLLINELLFAVTLGDWKIKLVSFQVKEEDNFTMAKLSQCKK
jgi:hypothetical protein